MLLLGAALACGRGLESPDPEVRARAVRALSRRSDDRDLPVLLVAQKDPSPLVRRTAAEVLAARGGPAAAEALGTLLADADPGVVAAAARGLAAMPSERRARDDLLNAYAGATPAGRAAIADALDRIGTSLREAVEIEAKRLWDRNLAAAERATGAVRAGAIEELGASARAEAVARLLPLVDPNRNPDRLLAAAAARGLGEAGDWSARPHLEALLTEPDGDVAEAAAQALGALGDPASADALAAAAAQGSSRFAAAALAALSALPQAPDVGVAVCELAARTLDPVVAARAARQARLREAECPDRLFTARLGRPGADPAALAALAELGVSGAGAEGAAVRIIALLEAGRFDAASRPAALRTLAALGWAGAAPVVARRAQAASTRIAEARARWIAGRLPTTPAPGFGGSPEARLAAAVARDPGRTVAVEAGPAAPGSEWVERVDPADAEELGAAAEALGRLRDPSAPALLPTLARDPDPAVRAGAVAGLAALGQDQALAPVAAALDDPDPRVRGSAAVSLPRFGAKGVPALAQAAGRAAPDDDEWRVDLARALSETSSEEAVAPLASLLVGGSAAEAARALGRLGVASAAKPLEALIAAPDGPARVDAIEALAQLPTSEGGAAVAAQLTSDRPEVRASAARALGRLRYEPASPRLEALRSDYCGRVRRAAVEALAKLPAGAPRQR
jgi:HEAT repeat protein